MSTEKKKTSSPKNVILNEMVEQMSIDKEEDSINCIYQVSVDFTYMQLTSLEISNFGENLTLGKLIAHINSAVKPLHIWSSSGFGGFYYLKACSDQTGRLILLGSISWCKDLINHLEGGDVNAVFYMRWELNNPKISSHLLTDHGEIFWEKNEANYKDARNLVWISQKYLKADEALNHVHDLVGDELRYFLVDSRMEDEYRTYLVGFYSDRAGRKLASAKTDRDLMIERKRDLKFKNLPNLYHIQPELFRFDQPTTSGFKASPEVADTYFLHRKIKSGEISAEQFAELCGQKIKNERDLQIALEKNNNNAPNKRDEKKRTIPKKGSWFRYDYNDRQRGRGYCAKRGHQDRGHHHRRRGFYRDGVYYTPI